MGVQIVRAPVDVCDVGNGVTDFVSNTATSQGLALTAAASTHTKSAWTELDASTAADAVALVLMLAGQSSMTYLIDIGVGAASSETVIIPNLHLTNHSNSLGYSTIVIPFTIPSGTRIAARYQAGATTNPPLVCMQVIGATSAIAGLGTAFTTYGADTTTSSGVTVTSSATINTKGAWAALTASSTVACSQLIVCAFPPVVALNSVALLLDIGTGAASSETVIIPDLLLRTSALNDHLCGTGILGPIPVTIPSGTRIAARLQSNVASQTYSVVVIGIP